MKTYTFATKIGNITILEQDNLIQKIILNAQKTYNDKPNLIIQETEKQILEYLDGKRKVIDVACNITGSVFEQSVLAEMKDIKYGETMSYKDLAIASGYPNAYRAVASVCRKNKFPIIYPCHRVIKSDGGVGEYSGGIALKKNLLTMEINYKCN